MNPQSFEQILAKLRGRRILVANRGVSAQQNGHAGADQLRGSTERLCAVVYHAMPGGATSSSQEGAMKQGYIPLLPYLARNGRSEQSLSRGRSHQRRFVKESLD